jgi:hypothetical protein
MIYATIDPYALLESFLLSQEILAMLTLFFFPKASAAPSKIFPSASRMAVWLALSILTRYSWSHRTLIPGILIFYAASLTCWISSSCLQITLTRSAFFRSLIIAAQRQFLVSSFPHSSLSIYYLILAIWTLALSSSLMWDVSIVQNNVVADIEGAKGTNSVSC